MATMMTQGGHLGLLDLKVVLNSMVLHTFAIERPYIHCLLNMLVLKALALTLLIGLKLPKMVTHATEHLMLIEKSCSYTCPLRGHYVISAIFSTPAVYLICYVSEFDHHLLCSVIL